MLGTLTYGFTLHRLVMRPQRIFPFVCFEVKNSNETLCGLYFSNCGFYRTDALEKSIDYLEMGC